MKTLFLICVVFLSGCVSFLNRLAEQQEMNSWRNQSYEQSARDINAAQALFQAGAPSRTPITTGQALSKWANAYTSVDYEWDWDEFYNEYRQLVWACRGVQSGQFAPEEKCAFKLKTDLRWPSK